MHKRRVYIVELKEPYKSQAAVAKRLGVTTAMVSKTLKSDGRWTVKGYHLRYLD